MRKNWKLYYVVLMILALLVTAAGCKNDSGASTQETEPNVTAEPTEDPRQKELADKYDAAVKAFAGESYALEVSYESSVTVAGQTYSESGEIIQDCRNTGEEEFLAKVNKTIIYGSDAHEVEIQEIFGSGKVYQKIGDGKFYAEITAEDFMDRLIPAKMLDPVLYTLSSNRDDTEITFSQGTAGEDWLMPEGAELINSQGAAELDADGKLLKTSYAISFRYGAAEHTISYEAVTTQADREPSVPKSTEEYVLVDQIDAAVLQEHVVGCLSQTRHVSANHNSLLVSAAAGIIEQKTYSMDAYANGEEYGAKVESSVHISTGNQEPKSNQMVEKMINGKYTYSLDGGKENTSSQMTQSVFEGLINDKLMDLMFSNEYISAVETTYLDGMVLLEFTGTEKMGADMCYDICHSMFNDGDILNNMASSYRTETIEYYIAIDGYSLLPTAAGIYYEGIHVIEGYECLLSQQTDQSFDLASISAHETVFEKSEPEEAPEKLATPLFYHVTGEEGQEMWLLGTIHIGDARTAYLPEEIYDAFYGADAFAVECDVDSFYDLVEEDESLQEKLSDMYFYSDGSTVEDHIDTPELYEAAKRYMKSTGNYFFNAEYMKVYLWGNSISNYNLQRGYALSPEKGVESRLLKLAEEADIPVKEVESTLFQMEMVTGYSDALQEFLLYGSMGVDAEEYWKDSQELYELWCAGDEAALIKKLTEEIDWVLEEEDIDLTELSGEDLEKAQAIIADLENINAQLAEIHKEYNESMSYNRNEGMLDVAVEYLESGETIFYAVGLAHLLDENGLVSALREAGYTVELVAYQ